MKAEGDTWIPLYRKILSWEWYHDSHMVHLMVHLIAKANHEETRYKGQVIKRGQHMTGFRKLAAETGMSVQKIRTCIKRLKSTQEITHQSTHKSTSNQHTINTIIIIIRRKRRVFLPLRYRNTRPILTPGGHVSGPPHHNLLGKENLLKDSTQPTGINTQSSRSTWQPGITSWRNESQARRKPMLQLS